MEMPANPQGIRNGSKPGKSVRRPRRPDKPYVGSAVSNGSRLFVQRPGDTAWHRRFKGILAQIINDLGGIDVCSEAQKQLARRAATLCISCERMECVAAAGKDIDLNEYGMMTDRLGRTLTRLGLKRQARDVTPDPLQFARNYQNGDGS
jgi:hypothetical protein